MTISAIILRIRQLKHFHLADPAYAEGVAQWLGIEMKEVTGTAMCSAGAKDAALTMSTSQASRESSKNSVIYAGYRH